MQIIKKLARLIKPAVLLAVFVFAAASFVSVKSAYACDAGKGEKECNCQYSGGGYSCILGWQSCNCPGGGGSAVNPNTQPPPPPPPAAPAPAPAPAPVQTGLCPNGKSTEDYRECCGPGLARQVHRSCPVESYTVGSCTISDSACGSPQTQPLSCPPGTFWYPSTNDCRGADQYHPEQSAPQTFIDQGTTSGGTGTTTVQSTYTVKPQQCRYVKDGATVTTSVCTCAYGYTCSGGSSSYGPVPPGNLDCFVVQGSDITCTKIGGTPTTLAGGQGTACDNPLSRGACGTGGCGAGEQRLCSAGVLGVCVKTDACASQVQTVSAGGSCSGLTRVSVGESSNGAFVGCQGQMNCFCPMVNGQITGTGSVTCIADNQNDSCGAPGVGTTAPIALAASIPPGQTPPPPGETPPPGSTPTPPPFVCLSMSKDIESPRFGQSVRFTCGTVTAATHYEFQYKVGTESGTIAPQNAGANVTIPFAITKLGSYKAQCRPCTATECAPWAETF